jgi:hypothetical protein
MSAPYESKLWLREASMRRLSGFVKNKSELIGNAAQLGVGMHIHCPVLCTMYYTVHCMPNLYAIALLLRPTPYHTHIHTHIYVGVLHPESIEKSGLDRSEIVHLEQWVAGEFVCVLCMCCAAVCCVCCVLCVCVCMYVCVC